MHNTLEILVRYQKTARASVPVLLQILNNAAGSTNETKILVRFEVIQALRQIDPEAADKADVK